MITSGLTDLGCDTPKGYDLYSTRWCHITQHRTVVNLRPDLKEKAVCLHGWENKSHTTWQTAGIYDGSNWVLYIDSIYLRISFPF